MTLNASKSSNTSDPFERGWSKKTHCKLLYSTSPWSVQWDVQEFKQILWFANDLDTIGKISLLNATSPLQDLRCKTKFEICKALIKPAALICNHKQWTTASQTEWAATLLNGLDWVGSKAFRHWTPRTGKQ